MSRKKYIVETAENGQTTLKKKLNMDDIKVESKVPTGKVKTKEAQEAKKKAHEEAYRAFRIAALKRRCKRMKVSEEDTKKYVEELEKQLDSPNEYNILLLFNKQEMDMVKESLVNNKIDYRIIGDYYAYIDGDTSVLDKVRSVVGGSVKIHPYAKKKPSVGPKADSTTKKKPTNNTSEQKAAAKDARKLWYVSRNTNRKKGKGKAVAKANKRKKLLELKKSRKVTTAQLNDKKPSAAVKTAKKAA